MAVRLVLLAAGGTASARGGSFADPAEPLDEGGREKARALRLQGPAPATWRTSPARAARETAAAIGIAAEPDAALRDIDRGDWSGLGLDAIDRAALAAWFAAPEDATPGGEAMADVAVRIRPWLDAVRLGGEPVGAVTHVAVIRAALAVALGLPTAATLAIDVAPLSTTVLSFHDRWRLQELRRA